MQIARNHTQPEKTLAQPTAWKFYVALILFAIWSIYLLWIAMQVESLHS